MKAKNIKILNPVLAAIFLITTLSMVQADRTERIKECASQAGDGAIYRMGAAAVDPVVDPAPIGDAHHFGC